MMAPARQAGKTAAKPSLVLVVDDEESMRFYLRRGLARLGYEVREAATAQSALRILSTQPVALALLDLRMPGRSGLDALPEILAAPSRPRVVVMTADASLEAALFAVGLGAADYVNKPFTVEAIAAVVARHLPAPSDSRGPGDPA